MSVTTRLRGALIPALDQACEVVAEVIRGLIGTVLVTTAGHVVRSRYTTTREVLDVPVVVRPGNYGLTPSGFEAPLPQQQGWIDSKALPYTCSQWPSLSNEPRD